jgi:hypothetical protein
LTVDRTAPRLIDRGDLLTALDRATARKVTIISAPAGSGKTSLLRAWAGRPGQPHRLAIMQVQREQQDAQQFWLALLGSVRQAGVASATVTVGQMMGGSIGTALLNTIFASAVAAYIAAHLASAALIGRQALAGLALAHGYDTAFLWIAGIFAIGAVVAGVLFRSGPLAQERPPSPAPAGVATAQAEAGQEQAR